MKDSANEPTTSAMQSILPLSLALFVCATALGSSSCGNEVSPTAAGAEAAATADDVLPDFGSPLPTFYGADITWDAFRRKTFQRHEISVNPMIGNVVYQYVDLETMSPRGPSFSFRRTYNSRDSGNYRSQALESPLGAGWTHSYDIFIEHQDYDVISSDPACVILAGTHPPCLPPEGQSWMVHWGDGRREFYDAATYTPTSALSGNILEPQPGGGFKLTTRDQMVYRFSAPATDPYRGSVAHLTSITDRNGNPLTLSYDGTGRLIAVTDPVGRVFQFTYDGSDRLAEILEPFYSDGDGLGRSVQFSYATANTISLLAAVTDPLGRTVSYAYELQCDGAGGRCWADPPYIRDYQLLTSIIDARSQLIQTFAYLSINPERHLVAKQTDALGNDTLYQYPTGSLISVLVQPPGVSPSGFLYEHDGWGQVEKITDPMGHTMRFNFRPTDRCLTFYENKRGYSHSFDCDSSGNLILHDRPGDRATTTATYNSRNDIETKTEQVADYFRLTRYTYDASGNLIRRQVEGNGGKVVAAKDWTYNQYGQVSSYTDPRGTSLIYAYDSSPAKGLQRICDAVANPTCDSGPPHLFQLTFGDRMGGLLRVFQNAQNDLFRLTYDRVGNLVTLDHPDGAEETFAYDGNNNLKTETNRTGIETDHFYNPRNEEESRVVGVGTPIEAIWRSEYDVRGNLAARVDPDGRRAEFEYDALDRTVLERRGPGSAVESTRTFGYDENGNLVSESDGEGRVTEYQYDENDDLVLRSIAAGTPAEAHYAIGRDPVGNVVTMGTPSGTTTFTRDLLDRIAQVLTPGSGASAWKLAYHYDAAGNLLGVQDLANPDPNARIWTFQYDRLNRLIERKDGVGNATTYTYWPDGVVQTRTDGNGATTQYEEYDEENRIKRLRYPDGTVVSFGYDANGNRISATCSGPANPACLSGTTTYGFDELDRITSVTDVFGRSLGYAYDGAGNRTRINYPDGKQVQYAYDALGRLATVADWNSRTVTYGYDYSDRVVQRDFPDGSRDLMGHDEAGRLGFLEVRMTPSGDPAYRTELTRDLAGNVISEARTGDLDPPVGGQTTSYQYDGAFQLTSTSDQDATYDGNGNLLLLHPDSPSAPPGDVAYQYDFENRLVSRSHAGGASMQYGYDAQGSRLRELGASGVPERFLALDRGEPDRVLQEYAADGSVVASYVWGLGLALRDEEGGGSYLYHHDPFGNAAILTSGGQVTDQYTYSPFGLSSQIGVTENPYRYAGQFGIRTMPDGTLAMGGRFYDPTLGRFLGQDPLKSRPDDAVRWNPYQFARANPLLYVDPSGRQEEALASLLDAYSGLVVDLIGEVTALDTAASAVHAIVAGVGTALKVQELREAREVGDHVRLEDAAEPLVFTPAKLGAGAGNALVGGGATGSAVVGTIFAEVTAIFSTEFAVTQEVRFSPIDYYSRYQGGNVLSGLKIETIQPVGGNRGIFDVYCSAPASVAPGYCR